MAELTLTFIGVANAFATGGASWSSFLLNKSVLFEAPPQVLMSVQTAGIDPNYIEVVLISHHHGDHFYGLPMLMLWWKWMDRMTPVTIVGPPGTERILRDITRETFPWLFDVPYDITWIEAVPGIPFEAGGISITPLEMSHDDTLNACLGFQCEVAGRYFGYTGDTVYCESVERLARWSEILVAECASYSGNPVHMDFIHDLPRVRALMRPEAHLLLTHIDPEVARARPPAGVIIAGEQRTYLF